jgi:hypothetical protein
MMPPIEAVRHGMGFDHAGRWHKARVIYMPGRPREENPLAPARGAIYGLLASGVLWVLLILAVRLLRTLM